MKYSIEGTILKRDGVTVGRIKKHEGFYSVSRVFTDPLEIELFEAFCGELSEDETIRALNGDWSY